MSNAFLRCKASFIIFVIVMSVFSIYNAEDVVAGDACCEKTRNDDSCMYTDSNDCDPQYEIADSYCEETNFCKLGCCMDLAEGGCYSSVSQASCADIEGSWMPDTNCNTLSHCEKGCCVVQDSCTYTTGQGCDFIMEDFPDLDKEFYYANTESDCLQVCDDMDVGCCSYAGGNCVAEPKNSCSGTFFDKACSDVDSCGCIPQDHKGCIDQDVYWFDSCDNAEELVEDCDYAEGTICDKRPTDEDYSCISLDCPVTYWDEKNVHDGDLGGARKNGESWCVYESPSGGYMDRPGTRHYRHICIDGREIIEQCRDYREEVCVQGVAEGLTNSQCVANSIYDSSIEENISTVPKGSRFWHPGEVAGRCMKAMDFCTVIWMKEDKLSDWDCEGNCNCEEQEFVDEMALNCKSQGDCGADFNVLGEYTDSAFYFTGFGKEGPDKPGKPSARELDSWLEYGTFGGIKDMFELLLNDVGNLDVTDYQNKIAAIQDRAQYMQAGAMIAAMVAQAALAGSLGAGAAGGMAAMSTAVGPFMVCIPCIVIIAAILIAAFILMAAEMDQFDVSWYCGPWEAPDGGKDCDKCLDENKVELLDYYDTCTEYKCKSLGKTCEFIPENAGTDRPACVDSNPNDVNSPVITPWGDILDSKYSIDSGPYGYRILPEVEAFSPITFGILTTELSQCKISDIRTDDFDLMNNYFPDNYYEDKHNITFNLLPATEYNFYVRCKDFSGNANDAEYAISLNTADSPDITPPYIQDISLADFSYVEADTPLTLYLNEPGFCKWSLADLEYNDMENDFHCSNEVFDPSPFYSSYECLDVLLLEGETNTYYIRCIDLSGNANTESFIYHLLDTPPLEIVSKSPDGEIWDTNNPIIQVITKGGISDGIANCRFSEENLPFDSMTPFFQTGSTSHIQQLNQLDYGSHKIIVKCEDGSGNIIDDKIEFDIGQDLDSPVLQYLYVDGGILHLIFDEATSCQYSESSFSFGDGTDAYGQSTRDNTISVGSDNYYIDCVDVYGNPTGELIIFTDLE